MLIQETILRELAVDFLIRLEQRGYLDEIEPREIDSLLRRIESDINKQLEEWKASNRLCDKAAELECEQTKEQCLRGDCPYKRIQQFLELFTKRFDRMVRSIRKRYLKNLEQSTGKITKQGANGKDWWQEYFEERRKELMVKYEKRLVDIVMNEQFLGSKGRDKKFWHLKARKRKKDGKVIINVSFPSDFLEQWPASAQATLLRLRNKMRTPEELVPLIRECGKAIRLYIESEKIAAKKRRRAEKRQAKRSEMGKIKKRSSRKKIQKKKKPNPKKAASKKKKK